MAKALRPVTTLKDEELNAATERATRSLEIFRSWLQQLLPGCPKDIAIGRDAFVFFLHKVALLPYTPEELLAIGRMETDRAMAFEQFEAQIREFVQQQGILTVPDWVQHYTFRPTPEYEDPVRGFWERRRCRCRQQDEERNLHEDG